MPGTTATPTKNDLEELLDDTADAVTAALDPALTREEVVSRLQDIAESLSDFGNEEDEGDEDDEDEEDDIIEG